MRKIKLEDEEYPKKLKAIKNPPKQLYVLGNEKLLQNKCVGIVGSRRCSYYGEKMSLQFSRELASQSITVISGLAIGIDTYAHMGAMLEEGKTIAVLGSGFNNVYPKQNKKLFEEIIQNGGCVITEYEPDVNSKTFLFPQRNRIIVGLSKCILVIDAGEKSGALITAGLAKEQNKKVFCIPSNLTNEYSMGSNMLIKDGANIALSSNDILEVFGGKGISKSDDSPSLDLPRPATGKSDLLIPFPLKTRVKIKIKNKLQKNIYDFLSDEPVNIEEIKLKVKADIKEINFVLTILEMEGYIKKLIGNKFVRK